MPRRPTGRSSRTIARQLPDLRGAADIGAGDGAFLERLRDAGFEETVGFEPSEAPLAAAPASVRDAIRPEPFSAGVLPDESFTLISCMQTIEHVLDPLDVCRDAVRALAPRGAVLIVCHDRRAFTRARPQAALADLRHRARPALLPPEHRRAAPPGRARANRGAAAAKSLSAAVLASARADPGGRLGRRSGESLGRSARRQAGEPRRGEPRGGRLQACG